MKPPIYMDNNATTPVDPRVLARMLPYFTQAFGNAASRSHTFGWQAEQAVEAAREQVARLIGATAREVVFTSGATEANNLALFGVAEAYAGKGKHIITQTTEHKAVLDPCKILQARGFSVTLVPVDEHGRADPAAVAAAITPETVLVSVMLANNEIGTIQPLAAIGAVCRRAGVLLHTDAVQGAGKIPFNVEQMQVDLASLSAHKMYGPKGVGALYVRRKNPRVRLAPILHGGGHERGLRSGTLNVPGIVGFGAAAELARDEGPQEAERLRQLRRRLLERILTALDGVRLNGHPEERLPGNLSLAFAGVEAEALMMSMREVAVSSGSACTSADLEPSHVLAAIGAGEAAKCTVRFGLGRFNTADDVDEVAARVTQGVRRLRELNAAWPRPGAAGAK